MDSPTKKRETVLLRELQEANGQITELKNKMKILEQTQKENLASAVGGGNAGETGRRDTLTNRDIRRYSRQLILPEIGVKEPAGTGSLSRRIILSSSELTLSPTGQLALINSSVLIVGAGGLGCPSAIYLAAAGVGNIGIVDYDLVELNNLHRQILHTEERLGRSKAQSASSSICCLNSSVTCTPHHIQLSQQNALPLIGQYDVVLDCTDNVATRYLLNDACVLAKKPLVSASALRFEGQLTVYNHEGGPCYRCLFPKPPPPETVTNCSDGGVLGVVPGTMGNLQALEAIKIIAGIKASFVQKLLLFDGFSGSFRTIKLRARKRECAVCGDNPTVRELMDYEAFCGAGPSDKVSLHRSVSSGRKVAELRAREQGVCGMLCLCLSLHILPAEERIRAMELSEQLKIGHPLLLLDVRPAVEFEICCLPDSFSTSFLLGWSEVMDRKNLAQGYTGKNAGFFAGFNIPLREIEKGNCGEVVDALEKYKSASEHEAPVPVVVVCRQGNESQLAVRSLKSTIPPDLVSSLRDLIGGLAAWANQVDPDFPQY